MHALRLHVLVGISLSLVCAAAGRNPARAAPNSAAAETLFEQGRRLMKQGRYAEACRKFEGSQRVDPSVGALISMGDCYLKLDRTASAWVAYRDASNLARRLGDQNRVNLAEAKAAPLEPHLARLIIVVNADGDVGNFEVRRDGQPVDPEALGTAIPIDPGEYEIEARGPSVKAYRRRIKVSAPGEQVTERIQLSRATVAAPEPPAPPAPPPEVPETTRPSPAPAVVVSKPSADPWGTGVFLGVTPSLGYASTGSSDIDASVSGLTLHAGFHVGWLFQRLAILGGLVVESATNPTLTFEGDSASGGMTMTSLALAAGAGFRVTPGLLLAGLARLTKVSISMEDVSLDSSFGPGIELLATQELFRRGQWSVGLVGSFSYSALDIEGTAWANMSAAIGVAGMFR